MKALMRAIAFHAVISANAIAAESIVGDWANDPRDCQDPEKQLGIRAMHVGGWFSCVFNNVRRRGDVVTWDGHCYSPDGSRRPESGDTPEAMTAVLSEGKLTLSGSGLAAGPLLRCK